MQQGTDLDPLYVSLFSFPNLALNYFSFLDDTKTGWFKQDGDATIDGVTMGPDAFKLFNYEQVAEVKTVAVPSALHNAGYRHTAYDVWESQKTIVAALKPHNDGNLIVLYNMESGQHKEVGLNI